VPIYRCILQRPRGILQRSTVRSVATRGAVSSAAGRHVGLVWRTVIENAAARQRAEVSCGIRVATTTDWFGWSGESKRQRSRWRRPGARTS